MGIYIYFYTHMCSYVSVRVDSARERAEMTQAIAFDGWNRGRDRGRDRDRWGTAHHYLGGRVEGSYAPPWGRRGPTRRRADGAWVWILTWMWMWTWVGGMGVGVGMGMGMGPHFQKLMVQKSKFSSRRLHGSTILFIPDIDIAIYIYRYRIPCQSQKEKKKFFSFRRC